MLTALEPPCSQPQSAGAPTLSFAGIYQLKVFAFLSLIPIPRGLLVPKAPHALYSKTISGLSAVFAMSSAASKGPPSAASHEHALH